MGFYIGEERGERIHVPSTNTAFGYTSQPLVNRERFKIDQ